MLQNKRKATIYDVAERAAASASTVAAVLNGSWEKRRIAAATAERVLKAAHELGYRMNRQASGLRTSRSGMIAMIIPLHDNRYFSSLSQSFELFARERKLCPVVVSTLRDPAEEQRTVETLISHNMDLLLIAGATDPDAVAALCTAADIPHLNIDLPGSAAPSVISDNYWGAHALAMHLFGKAGSAAKEPGQAAFIGGLPSDFNTQERLRAFIEASQAATGDEPDSAMIHVTGYDPEAGETAMRMILKRLGRLPRVLLVNSTIAFEGVFRCLQSLPLSAFDGSAIGCYDFDPFLEHLQFPVSMVRQDAQGIVAKAFELLDEGVGDSTGITMVKPKLVLV
jgi:LacI family transcriptional regulator, fructose operon transcriptional repressor